MSMREGEQLTILDDGHGEWWMARRERTGEEGWVPKGYLATADQYDEHLRQQLEEVVKEMSIDGKEDSNMFINQIINITQFFITTHPQTVWGISDFRKEYQIIVRNIGLSHSLILSYNNLL